MLLYVHIPFCDIKCPYCDFNSYTDINSLKKQYMQTLLSHLQYSLLLNNVVDITSIYIGGGTPNTIKASFYKSLFNILNPLIKPQYKNNICVEANPKKINKNWLKDMYLLGVRRLSIGVQSFDEKKLKMLGRNHSKKDIFLFVKEARMVGFKNISIDLIYDTRLDSKKILVEEMQNVSLLDVEHISAYSLMLKEKTAFFKKKYLKKNSFINAKFLFNLINKEGFMQYEISSFSKNKKFFSFHNLGYWSGKDFLAIGSGAVEQINHKRNHYQDDVSLYIKNYKTPMSIEKLSNENLLLEKLFLGLRSMVGVDIDVLDNEAKQKLDILYNENKVNIKGSKFFCNDYLLADEIALYLS